MFGYIIANLTLLDEAQKQRYQSCYCGLCHMIRTEFSSLSRLSLNYDMTFLVLLLSSLYEPEETASQSRCAAHPLRRRPYWQNRCTRYCAAMNIMLAYDNCMDDWNDDRSVLSLAEAQVFRGGRAKAAGNYPRQSAAIAQCLSQLSGLERSGLPDPDGAANCFGRLMGELFVPDEDDHWAPLLRTVGEGLGRFIYTLDAAVDLEDDLRQSRYNPLSALAAEGRTLADFQEELTLLIAECTEAFERLPLVQDADLMRNILYSGVWLKYTQALDRQTRTNHEGGPYDSRSL